jgi:glucokinase
MAGTLLGVDVGGTQIKAARVSGQGQILELLRIATPDGLNGFRKAAQEIIAALGADAPPVGVGCKGIIETGTTRVAVLPGTLHYLEGQRLSDLFAGAGEVRADNDARAALLGECRWGAAQGRQHVLMLTLGTGVGGGVLSAGRALRGAGGVGGHLGHLTVNPDGELCICGNRGCLETVFSSRAIESAAAAAIHRGVPSALLEASQPVSCDQVFDAARAGDVLAADIVARATHTLAAAIAGLALTFDPEIVILGGQIAGAGDLLFDPLRAELVKRTRLMLKRDLPVVRAQLSDASGVCGAAALALES